MRLEFPTLTKGKVIDFNPRSEKRGAHDLVPAFDVRLQVDTTSDQLGQLDPELRDWLYKHSTQDTLPGVDKVADLVDLRFPDLGFPLHWGGESKGYTLALDMGIDPADTGILLHAGKVSRVAITARHGGTVQLAFTASFSEGISESDVGRLGTRVQHDVFFTLVQKLPEDLPSD